MRCYYALPPLIAVAAVALMSYGSQARQIRATAYRAAAAKPPGSTTPKQQHGPARPGAPTKPGSPLKPGGPSPGAPEDEPGAASPVRPATEAERKAVKTSIVAQLDAFRKDDYEGAAFYQSSGLKNNFSSVEAFRQMMQTSYPQFAHYKSVNFGPAVAQGLHVMIRATVTGQDEVKVPAAYVMVLEGKIYKIESVVGGRAAPNGPPSNSPDSRPGHTVEV